nr:uncharacterized protein LOC101886501 [Danio rerio]|eukprot:XP_017208842.1 uncharacterized protein LOC101886501 [Danio rerio]
MEPSTFSTKLLKTMDISWIFLLHLICSLDVSCAESDETKLALVKDRDAINLELDSSPLKIRRFFPLCSQTDTLCILMCSTNNAQGAILSWYNETKKCSSIDVDNLSPTISLNLYVKYQDENTYSCVFHSSISPQTQNVTLSQYCDPCPDITKTAVPVRVGDNLTLHTNLKSIQKMTQVVWRYGPEKTVIAEILENEVQKCDYPDGRFKSKLYIDSQTGDLKITNASHLISGVYKLLINNFTSRCWSFNLSVHNHLPTPQISIDSSYCPSSFATCMLDCSVMNVSQVNLTWYKGQTLLSHIFISDQHKNFECLDVHFEDKNNYSCVVSNSFINETKEAAISELCSGKKKTFGLAVGFCVAVALITIVCFLVYKHLTQNGKYYLHPIFEHFG